MKTIVLYELIDRDGEVINTFDTRYEAEQAAVFNNGTIVKVTYKV